MGHYGVIHKWTKSGMPVKDDEKLFVDGPLQQADYGG